MSTSRIMKWITGGLEAFLAIPILGGSVVIGLIYIPLVVMLGLHIATLVICVQDGSKKHGSILGIVTSCVAWIPFVGWTMHLITAILLMIDAGKTEQKQEPTQVSV